MTTPPCSAGTLPRQALHGAALEKYLSREAMASARSLQGIFLAEHLMHTIHLQQQACPARMGCGLPLFFDLPLRYGAPALCSSTVAACRTYLVLIYRDDLFHLPDMGEEACPVTSEKYERQLPPPREGERDTCTSNRRVGPPSVLVMWQPPVAITRGPRPVYKAGNSYQRGGWTIDHSTILVH